MSSPAPELLLTNHLKTLKLPTFLREHDKLARQWGLSGFPCVGGYNGEEGDPLCPDARSR